MELVFLENTLGNTANSLFYSISMLVSIPTKIYIFKIPRLERETPMGKIKL